MILIDWWSPKPHLEFNKNLYKFMSDVNQLYIFDSHLKGLEDKCILKKNYKSRFLRAFSVINICLKHRKEKIFFISYDVLFIPIIQVFAKKIFCYEHNTTPESLELNKHALWQRLTFFNIKRLCQSLSQKNQLDKINQKSYWVGLPVSETERLIKEYREKVFVFVSERLNANDAKKIVPHLYGKLLVKKSIKDFNELNIPMEIKVYRKEKINIPEDFNNAEALIIAINSNIRGTGWYIEALKYGVPIIITSKKQAKVFESTYPGYPFISTDDINSKSCLKDRIRVLREFDNQTYVENYMIDFKNRLMSAFNDE